MPSLFNRKKQRSKSNIGSPPISPDTPRREPSNKTWPQLQNQQEPKLQPAPTRKQVMDKPKQEEIRLPTTNKTPILANESQHHVNTYATNEQERREVDTTIGSDDEGEMKSSKEAISSYRMEEEGSDHHDDDQPMPPLHKQNDSGVRIDQGRGFENSKSPNFKGDSVILNGNGNELLGRDSSNEESTVEFDNSSTLVVESDNQPLDALIPSSSSAPCEEEMDTTSTIATGNSNNNSTRSQNSTYKPSDVYQHSSTVSEVAQTEYNENPKVPEESNLVSDNNIEATTNGDIGGRDQSVLDMRNQTSSNIEAKMNGDVGNQSSLDVRNQTSSNTESTTNGNIRFTDKSVLDVRNQPSSNIEVKMNGDVGFRDQSVFDKRNQTSSLEEKILAPPSSSPFVSVNSNSSINASGQINYLYPSSAQLPPQQQQQMNQSLRTTNFYQEMDVNGGIGNAGITTNNNSFMNATILQDAPSLTDLSQAPPPPHAPNIYREMDASDGDGSPGVAMNNSSINNAIMLQNTQYPTQIMAPIQIPQIQRQEHQQDIYFAPITSNFHHHQQQTVPIIQHPQQQQHHQHHHHQQHSHQQQNSPQPPPQQHPRQLIQRQNSRQLLPPLLEPKQTSTHPTRKAMQLRLCEQSYEKETRANNTRFFSSMRQKLQHRRSLSLENGTSVDRLETNTDLPNEVGSPGGLWTNIDRGMLMVSWYEGTTTSELKKHLRKSLVRKLRLGPKMILENIRIIDQSVEPHEEIVLSPFIPDGSSFLLKFFIKILPENSDKVEKHFGAPQSPSAAPSLYHRPEEMDDLQREISNVLVSKTVKTNKKDNVKDASRPLSPPQNSVKTEESVTRSTAILDDLSKVIDSHDSSSQESSSRSHEQYMDNDMLAERIEALFNEKLGDAQYHPIVEKRQVVFTIANYFVLFLSVIAISAEIHNRAPRWIKWMDENYNSVQDCAADRDALFECISRGDMSGLVASIVLWATQSVATKQIFLFGFDSPTKLWVVVYEAGVTAVCWGTSYMFIRRGLNPDTRENFLQKYWKDAVYGSLAGFNAGFMKAVLKNLIPQEQVLDVLEHPRIRILEILGDVLKRRYKET